MQTFSIPYYKDHVTLNVPDENLKAAIYPKAESYQAALPEAELVREALEHPIGSEKLCELAKGKKKITIVTSDHTRPVPSKITLPILLAELRKGNPEAEITILIATGLHRETTQAEQRQMFGDKIVDEERIVVNNAFRKEDFDFVCKLPSEAELWVNREALTCDLLITEGFIEPHFFAGSPADARASCPVSATRRRSMRTIPTRLSPIRTQLRAYWRATPSTRTCSARQRRCMCSSF